jgi:uncharacterized membrane protein YgdD (TMEM256/DUF423 family)
MNRNILIIAVCMIVLAIILGAFGAHGLKELVTTEKLASFETGVKYQMYHGLALLAIGLNADKIPFSLKTVSTFLLLGTILFSVSIYFLTIQDLFGASLRFLGPVTPLGGSLLIVGWMIFLVKLVRSKA